MLHYLTDETCKARTEKLECPLNKACPACQKIYKITTTHIGKRILCTKCKTVLIVTDQGLGIPEPQLPPQASAVPVPTQAVVHWQQGVVPPQTSSPPQEPFEVVEDSGSKHTGGRGDDEKDAEDAFDLDEVSDDDWREAYEPLRKPRWMRTFGSGCGLVKWT